MKYKKAIGMTAMFAMAGALGAGVALADDPNKPSEFGRVGNKGEGFSEEHTIKGKGQNPQPTLEQDVQVNLGGARPVVDGEILKIEGEKLVLKDATGSQVLVRVNKDTNLDCAARTAGEKTAMSTGRQQADEQREIPPTAHMQEQSSQEKQQQSSTSNERIGDQSGTQEKTALGKDSGGDIARGSGFRFGPQDGCNFKVGDKVRAEVSDLGTVTYLRRSSDQDTRSQQAMSGQMIQRGGSAMPGEQASAQQQREQMMKPGSVPAPGDLRNPDASTAGKQTAKAQTQNLCDNCHIVRGQVVRSDPDSLMVKDSSQKEIRLKIDKGTQMGQVSHPEAATFVEGDRIEAYVTEDGRAWSITTLKQQQSQPGVIGAPGD